MEKINSVKKAIFEQVLTVLKENETSTKAQVEQTRKDMIAAPGRMQSRHDSSKQELSYLLGGLQKKLRDTQLEISSLEGSESEILLRKSESFQNTITVGSLVKIKRDGKEYSYFILPAGGGIEIKAQDIGEITVITPQSPLANVLLGKSVNCSMVVNEKEIVVVSVM